MIMRARETSFDWPVLEKRLSILESHCANRDMDGIRRQLEGLVEGYRSAGAPLPSPVEQSETIET